MESAGAHVLRKARRRRSTARPIRLIIRNGSAADGRAREGEPDASRARVRSNARGGVVLSVGINDSRAEQPHLYLEEAPHQLIDESRGIGGMTGLPVFS
jgi:hypothetical protein